MGQVSVTLLGLESVGLVLWSVSVLALVYNRRSSRGLFSGSSATSKLKTSALPRVGFS